MKSNIVKSKLFLLICLLISLSGCTVDLVSQEAASIKTEPPFPTHTATSLPVATSTNTPTRTPSSTATPTLTPLPTETPAPTTTSTPIATYTSTPSLTATPWSYRDLLTDTSTDLAERQVTWCAAHNIHWAARWAPIYGVPPEEEAMMALVEYYQAKGISAEETKLAYENAITIIENDYDIAFNCSDLIVSYYMARCNYTTRTTRCYETLPLVLDEAYRDE
ncbi:MAG: hypothetical protein AAF485_01485 [Chloroflexota bacterium]